MSKPARLASFQFCFLGLLVAACVQPTQDEDDVAGKGGEQGGAQAGVGGEAGQEGEGGEAGQSHGPA